MADQKWTPTQKEAIESVGKNLLVSAAAGSGKTSVLTQRCVYLVCDAPNPCDVDQLLVVTFTEAAAAEMKSRFAEAMAARYADRPDAHIGKQLAMIDRAYIGTLHGFCSRLLRRHFTRIGLDPGFRILDPDEAALMRVETAREMFADRYAEQPDEFRNFVDCYATGGGDDRLFELVLRSHSLLCSVIRPQGWMREAAARIDDAIAKPLNQSVLGKELLGGIRSAIDGVLQQCDVALAGTAAERGLAKYHTYLLDIRATAGHVGQAFNDYGIDAAADILSTLDFPRLPTVSGEVPGKDRARQAIDDIRDEIKKGSWKKSLAFTEAEWIDGLMRIRPHLDVLLSLLADFAERFSAAKNAEGAIDFADLEMLTLRCLTETTDDGKFLPSEIARSYQTAIEHVLVDEYQDINELQNTLLSLLSHERSKLVPNLFCVGDVKQSIYRFRLADPGQFLVRRERYASGKAGKVIDLQQNFRSRGPLLNAINSLFASVMSRDATDLDYDDTQRLQAGAIFPPGGDFTGAPVELHILDEDAAPIDPEEDLGRLEVEAVLVGRRILEIVGKTGQPARRINDRGVYRPAGFKDIVVLLRSLQHRADPMAAVLRRMGVPVFSESRTGYFTAVEVNDVLATLHLLDNVRQDIPLAAFLRGPIANLPESESAMGRIRLAYPEISFSAAVWKYADEQTGPLADHLRRLRDRLQDWRQLAREQPVSELIRVLYEQTSLLTYAAGLPGGQQRVANLVNLQDRAAQFGSFRRQGLSRFLAFLEKLKDQSDLGQPSISSEADDVVRIVSIHRSKGLEYPIVIVPDLGKGMNFGDERSTVVVDRELGFGIAVVDEEREILYPSLATTVVKRRLHRHTLAEETRVLYVAATRAKEHLILIGTGSKTQLQKWHAAGEPAGEPLSPEKVLAATHMLDWIAPAAFRAQAGLFQIFTPTDAPAGDVGPKPGRETAMNPDQQARADWQLIDPPPAVSEVAAEMIGRVTWQYPFVDATRRAAATSVTSLVKKKPAAGDGQPVGPLPTTAGLEMPRFLGEMVPMSAADRGTATHAVLEFLKFDDADSVDAIERQIDQLVAARRLEAAAKKEVDVAAIDWMMRQPVGELLRTNAAAVRREVPVYFDAGDGDAGDGDCHDGDSGDGVGNNGDPADRPMVRGRIDLLVDHGGAWTIVDYKTDRVAGDEQVAGRVELYAGQLRLYAAAIRRITGKPVERATLVFLTPREVREVRLN